MHFDKHPLRLGGAHPVSKQVVRELDELNLEKVKRHDKEIIV